MYRITAAKLTRSDFCPNHIILFKQVFPKGVPFSLETLKKAQKEGLDVRHVFIRAIENIDAGYVKKFGPFRHTLKCDKRLYMLDDLIIDWPKYHNEVRHMNKRFDIKMKREATRILTALWRKRDVREQVRKLIAVEVRR